MTVTLSTETELFKGFDPGSKVWIYSSARPLALNESGEINKEIAEFTSAWTAHDVSLRASGKVIYDHFIVLCVDESHSNASGCSIDKSVRFIRKIETDHKTDLFDRLTVFYLSGNDIKSFRLPDLKEKMVSGEISTETRILDTSILTLGQLRTDFIKSAGNSWLAKFM